MRAVYSEATLMTADMNFSINHSVVPASDAFAATIAMAETAGFLTGNSWVMQRIRRTVKEAARLSE